jgi:hypothetical protein
VLDTADAACAACSSAESITAAVSSLAGFMYCDTTRRRSPADACVRAAPLQWGYLAAADEDQRSLARCIAEQSLSCSGADALPA